MQFDSYTYALFLPIVFLLYWALARKLKWQNAMLLAASYTFYGWWDWRFLGLIIVTSLSTYATALAMKHQPSRKTAWAALNIVINLCILFTFKYLDFFRDNTVAMFNTLGMHLSWPVLNLVLPVGISFYTFQAISYTLDVKRGDVAPTTDIVAFMVYIAFFPQLVAGPIERARNLLPQFLVTKQFDYHNAVVGMRQILWGLTKKIVVADSLASYVDNLLYHPTIMSASSIAMASVIFAFQIYADFSGYSDIAIGSARLLNIRLTANFRYPFFSRTWNELWQRWHISLMTWLRTYIYYPLGGSRCSRQRTALNVMIVFALSGLWHGAAWTFVIWGLLCGLFMMPHVLLRKTKVSGDATLRDLPSMLLIFAGFCLVFLVFRAHSMDHLTDIASTLACGTWLAIPMGVTALYYIVPLTVIDWLGRKHEFPLQHLPMPTWARWAIYWTLLTLIAYYSTGQQINYIYFQF